MPILSLTVISLLFIPLFIQISLILSYFFCIILPFRFSCMLLFNRFSLPKSWVSLFVFPFPGLSTTDSTFFFPFSAIFFLIAVFLTSRFAWSSLCTSFFYLNKYQVYLQCDYWSSLALFFVYMYFCFIKSLSNYLFSELIYFTIFHWYIVPLLIIYY